MKEYIDRSATVDALNKLCDRVCQYSKAQRKVMCGACPLGDAFTVIEDDLPTADVVEVRHGTPIRHFMRFCNSDGEVLREIMDGWECPFCHNVGAENYCPNCGAKMDGGVNDA